LLAMKLSLGGGP